MPVTLYPSENSLAPVLLWQHRLAKEPEHILLGQPTPSSTEREGDRLAHVIFKRQQGYDPVLEDKLAGQQSRQHDMVPTDPPNMIPSNNKNGFLGSAIEAYIRHHHLVIRPDDVWTTILTQLNYLVNGNYDELRKEFVNHDGQKQLLLALPYETIDTVDLGWVATQFADMLAENIRDPTLRDWIIQDFTTTTETDRAISSAIMMSTLQKCFKYMVLLGCGLPQVTLLGELQDWENLALRIDRLCSFGDLGTRWHALLKPVLSRFVETYKHPQSEDVRRFWRHITTKEENGSKVNYMSGWLTAFCFFDRKGQPLPAEAYLPLPEESDKEPFSLDGVVYPRIETLRIPPAYASVPIKMVEYGRTVDVIMVAGCVGMAVSDSGTVSNSHDGKSDTVQPILGWWIFEGKIEPEVPDPQAETASLSTATSEIPDLSIVKRVQGIIGKVRRPWSVKWAKSKR